jgi:hypothetical protein
VVLILLHEPLVLLHFCQPEPEFWYTMLRPNENTQRPNPQLHSLSASLCVAELIAVEIIPADHRTVVPFFEVIVRGNLAILSRIQDSVIES